MPFLLEIYMILPNYMLLSITFSFLEYVLSVMQSHLSQPANDIYLFSLINDMSVFKPV